MKSAMIDFHLEPGQHKRFWCIELRDAASGEYVLLPVLEDWHEAVHMLNELAKIYGLSSVQLYQWEINAVVAPQQAASD